jgi:hypothetical protein
MKLNGPKCCCCGSPYTESIEERRAMHLASLMVRLMRRRHQAHEVCGPHPGTSIESMKAKIRFIVSYQRHKVLLEKFMDLLMSVESGVEHWLDTGRPR